jgi:hypothetical protein
VQLAQQELLEIPEPLVSLAIRELQEILDPPAILAQRVTLVQLALLEVLAPLA